MFPAASNSWNKSTQWCLIRQHKAIGKQWNKKGKLRQFHFFEKIPQQFLKRKRYWFNIFSLLWKVTWEIFDSAQNLCQYKKANRRSPIVIKCANQIENRSRRKQQFWWFQKLFYDQIIKRMLKNELWMTQIERVFKCKRKKAELQHLWILKSLNFYFDFCRTFLLFIKEGIFFILICHVKCIEKSVKTMTSHHEKIKCKNHFICRNFYWGGESAAWEDFEKIIWRRSVRREDEGGSQAEVLISW